MNRRFVRAALFGAIVGAALVLVLVLVARRPRRIAASLSRTPTGGAAQEEEERSALAGEDGAAEGAIVEDARRYGVLRWSFGLERYELRIEDAGMSPALGGVLARTGAELVVNAGFFDPEGKPIGLAISNGVVLSRLAKRLSGGVLTSDGERADLFPSEGFELPDGGRFAVQCRPRLVVDGAANVKSDDGKRAERTALCTREAGHTVDVFVVRGSDDGESPGPSLFALARHLAGAGCDSALNLDGGPSTGVAWREGTDVKLLAPRGPVRHVVAFHARR